MLFSLLLFAPLTLAIWPEPVKYAHGDSYTFLADEFTITTTDSYPSHHRMYVNSFSNYLQSHWYSRIRNGNQTDRFHEEHILAEAIARTEKTIKTSKFVPWKFHSRYVDWEPVPPNGTKLFNVQIQQKAAPAPFSARSFFEGDESYSINIDLTGTAIIVSNDTIGTIRALQTFEQLSYTHSSGCHYVPYTPLQISDYPRWRHRGLNLDISRNVFDPADVKRTIDAMATTKMSRLHVHATDAQSWPIDVPSLPGLAEKGAYMPSLVWSVQDLQDVQIYGIKRGISVFIEIDMPGHTGSIWNSRPELVTAFNKLDWSTFAAEPPSGQLKLNSSKVYDFLETLFDDLLPRVSPWTTNFHNGGDEVNAQAFLLDETVRSNQTSVLQPLVQKLMSYVTGRVSSAGLNPIVWEEMVVDWNITLPTATNCTGNSTCRDTIIQVWREAKNLQAVLAKGYRALFGDYNNWYLDCGNGQWLTPYPSGVSPPGVPYNTSGGVATVIKDPFLDYCSPVKNWKHVYTYDPLVNITTDVQYLIEGGDTHMWAEQVDPVNLDGRVWPRAAAAAEVLWAGPRNSSQIDEASYRLAEWRERAVIDHGIASGMVQMTWCLMEGGCQL